MTRLASTLRWEATLQFRHGFYAVSAFVAVLWVLLLRQLPPGLSLELARIVPAMMVLNLILTTFYYVGALVLLEKGDGVLGAFAVSPLREREYLLVKVLSLSALGLVESLLIVVLAFGTSYAIAPLAVGTALLGALYVLLGLVAIGRHDAINGYLLPSILWVTFLTLPLLDELGIWESPVVYLHPLKPFLLIIHAAFEPLGVGEALVALGSAGAWLAGAYWGARRSVRSMVRRAAGGG